ncbi:hypothetical protein HKX23_17645 [Sulfitobacter sp. KE29]|uniref:hypothetical protein n=1 Tax=unclassified Sulfitobacter TaxID=196795 RepID=UPI0023E191CE|nr:MULTISPECIES: hypothetical protein [unclassified Sulfitobacter]MDF3420176.1 hypothetical protein [Sulfitobacter sp. Ks38]MDF3427661.1 hypothetical protein [Sulfitobacter sp. KE29]MDF3431240.1 hypothetical protein [Sulfitobacter sp. S46]MDF3446013.1 hypothetical protein [Sulfitobacter sp. KE31]MDF3550022.1 hypothetical protein [Sulfitobacter sp. KE28]
MADPDRFTPDGLLRLAASGVAKVDLMGPRGTTLCTMEEIEAMAALIAISGLLPGHPTDPKRQPRFVENERTKDV